MLNNKYKNISYEAINPTCFSYVRNLGTTKFEVEIHYKRPQPSESLLLIETNRLIKNVVEIFQKNDERFIKCILFNGEEHYFNTQNNQNFWFNIIAQARNENIFCQASDFGKFLTKLIDKNATWNNELQTYESNHAFCRLSLEFVNR